MITRKLQEGMRGQDVRAVKEKLFELGYYSDKVQRITHDRFGRDTTAAVKAFQKAKGLEEDGIVGEKTAAALFTAQNRILKYLMRGEDVREMKEKLFFLGMYDEKIGKITNDCFGRDTVNAVKAFQRKYHLAVDGIIGKNTRSMLEQIFRESDQQTEGLLKEEDYPRIGRKALEAINIAVGEIQQERLKMVTEALKYATDASLAVQYDYPSSLYIRGGNLYDKNLQRNVITEKYLTETYRKRYPGYITSGRLEMMVEAVRKDALLTGADCSGGIVGLLRYFGFVSADFDDTANGLCGGHSQKIKKNELTPGDFVGRDGHICLYVGGGYLVEWVGGEYGCQMTDMNDHKAWSFTRKKFVRQKTCNKYCRPKFYIQGGKT